jgi:hypothetical protein
MFANVIRRCNKAVASALIDTGLTGGWSFTPGYGFVTLPMYIWTSWQSGKWSGDPGGPVSWTMHFNKTLKLAAGAVINASYGIVGATAFIKVSLDGVTYNNLPFTVPSGGTYVVDFWCYSGDDDGNYVDVDSVSVPYSL